MNPDRNEFPAVIDLVCRAAGDYIAAVDDLPVRDTQADTHAARFDMDLPETGPGAEAALKEIIDGGFASAIASSGPKFYHFVIGGVTPAAHGADWIATSIDQLASDWVLSPMTVTMELVALKWLQSLFGLPETWSGVMTTGATVANFVGLTAARQWWSEQHGVDIAESGFAGMPAVPVFSSGYLHPASTKSLAMLGIGRNSARRFARDDVGRLDCDALETALRDLGGKPAILIGNAGEVNGGDFDPIERMADLAQAYNAWLHIDGAFGLFAAVSSRTRHLVKGIERADSVTVDGHKWLNVPYDCGFSFFRDPALLSRAFHYTADYLPDPDDPAPGMTQYCPEGSRRARSLPVWATLRAYGRSGVRDMVETHLDLAQHLAKLIDAAPDLERLSEVPLNIVCFRYNPGSLSGEELDAINDRLGQLIISDGRYYAGTTRYKGMTAMRPAIVNWRTREADIDGFVEVIRELGRRARSASV